MYTLKSNGNFTIVINDIQATVTQEHDVVIDEDTYNASNDIKKLEQYLIIRKNDNVVDSNIVELENNTTNNTIFVAYQEDVVESKDVFVKVPENVETVETNEDENNEVTTDNIVVQEEVKYESEVEVETETTVDVVSETKDDFVEVKNEKVKNNKENKKQKGRPKKINNK